jgi:hypothetical protein
MSPEWGSTGTLHQNADKHWNKLKVLRPNTENRAVFKNRITMMISVNKKISREWFTTGADWLGFIMEESQREEVNELYELASKGPYGVGKWKWHAFPEKLKVVTQTAGKW